MARLVKIESNKTYATKENCIKAVEKFPAFSNLRYFIVPTDDGRFFPVFLGEAALQAQAHFHFPVAG